MSMLMQGLSMVYNLRSRILVQANEARTDRLREYLIFDLLSSLTPDDSDGDAVFAGNEDGFYGMSLLPLQESAGVPAQIRFWADNGSDESRLLYKQYDLPSVQMGKWQSEKIQFVYMDKAGDEYSTWPQRNSNMPQLPAVIEIRLGKTRASSYQFVPVLGRKQPRATVQGIF
jgi:hypothetical protein